MDKVTIFMNAEDKADVLSHYTLVDQDSPEFDTYVKVYPALAEESVYVLNDGVSKNEIKRLEPIIAKPFLVVSTIQMALDNPDMAAQMGAADLGFDISQIPKGMNIFAMLERLPKAQLAQIQEKINAQFETFGDGMLLQAAVAPVKAEYEALGMDTAKLQNNYILRVGGIMLLLTLLSGIATIAVGYLSAVFHFVGHCRNVRIQHFQLRNRCAQHDA